MSIYRNIPKHKPRAFVAELKAPAVIKQYRASMKDVKLAVGKMFKGVLPTLQSYINSATDADGKLNPARRNETARQAGEAVHRLFVGTDGRNAFAQDGVTAISPFAQLLNEFYVRVTMEAIYTQRNWMRKNMPPQLFSWLSRQQFFLRLSETENPFLRQDGESDEAFLQRMKDLRVFSPNPMMELDPNRQWVPMHLWNDPNGYQLSQRIWNTANNTRRKIDELITEAFNQGWSSLELSRKLEQFLLPERASLRTNSPYGSDASFDAMRLARTEIARAANQAAYVSAYLNPYVSKIDIARSPNGDPTCKTCPQHATIGIGGERIRPPYSIHAAYISPYHSFCMCNARPVLDDDPATVTNRLIAVMDDARASSFPPAVTPANVDAFTNMLLHRALSTIIGQVKGQLPLMGF